MSEQPTSKQKLPASGLELAIFFHETYERLAPQFGYETRPDTKAFSPSSKNGQLMVAVCDQVLGMFRTADETPAVTVDVPKLQTDLELAHAAINRVYTGRVRDMLRLLSDNEISSARAHEWLTAFVRDGVDRPMPGDADKTSVPTSGEGS